MLGNQEALKKKLRMDNHVHVPQLNPTPASSYQPIHRQTPPQTTNNYDRYPSRSVPSAYRRPIVADTKYERRSVLKVDDNNNNQIPQKPHLNTTPDSQRGIRVVGSNSPSQSEIQRQNDPNRNSENVIPTLLDTTNQTQTKLNMFNNFRMPHFLIVYGNEITIICFFLLLIMVVYHLSWLYAEASPDTCRRNRTTQRIFREKLLELQNKSMDDVRNQNYDMRLKKAKYSNPIHQENTNLHQNNMNQFRNYGNDENGWVVAENNQAQNSLPDISYFPKSNQEKQEQRQEEESEEQEENSEEDSEEEEGDESEYDS